MTILKGKLFSVRQIVLTNFPHSKSNYHYGNDYILSQIIQSLQKHRKTANTTSFTFLHFEKNCDSAVATCGSTDCSIQ